MLSANTLAFLNKLQKNNNKEWFDKNRSLYEEAKLDFENLVQQLIATVGKDDEEIALLKPKDCTFRINRDIRFSKDKTPYKTNMGAYIVRGGKKSLYAGYYFHCEPGRSFVGGGLWMPQPAELKKVRQEIDYCWDEFKGIVQSKKFKSVYSDLSRDAEYTLAKVPRDYDKDNPAAEYLKLKSLVGLHNIADNDITSKALVKKVTEAFTTLKPVIDFINRSLE